MDTPISELGGAGVAVGAAITGLKPIFEFQFPDFAALAMEQIVNQVAKTRNMLGARRRSRLSSAGLPVPAPVRRRSTARALKLGSGMCPA